jgi:outer membrane protein OmpA-like peptidoglycan-associated protein
VCSMGVTIRQVTSICVPYFWSIAFWETNPLPDRREFSRSENSLQGHPGVSDRLTSMNDIPSIARRERCRRRSGAPKRFVQRGLIALGAFGLIVAPIVPFAQNAAASGIGGSRGVAPSSTVEPHSSRFLSVGLPDATEPSGQAPPTTSAIAGYQLRDVTSFDSGALPANWFIFSGTASGDSGSRWATSHVTVSKRMLQLNTYQDPNFNSEWVSGGICQCNSSYTYGAFFVRSRMTGPGPTQVEMLWPVSGWPPEIDFNETYGSSSASQATLHYTSANIALHKNISIDMTKWHTWGIVWTPLSIQYTVDGRVWGTINDPAIVPHQPMSLHFQQQTWCASNYACPTSPQSTQINWVAAYSSTTPQPFEIGSFVKNSVALTPTIESSIRLLATNIVEHADLQVTITGYANSSSSSASNLAISRQRASNVKKYLQQQLSLLHDPTVFITAVGLGGHRIPSALVNARINSGELFATLG